MAKFDLSTLPPQPTLEFERELWARGYRFVAGIDEAGRGPLAGPVAAGAAILPVDPGLEGCLCGVRDSKQMTPAQREYWAGQIHSAACACAVGFASSGEIDEIGILPATRLAMQRAIESLPLCPDYVLIDFVILPADLRPQLPLVKGDARSLSIAAASVLAKTARDALCYEYERQYPGYGFASHKGYATAEHLAAIQRLGPCPIHRMSFSPFKIEDELT
ncbi:MAG: ribonuclease HII [Omnitrophica WOR_2 bacterium]